MKKGNPCFLILYIHILGKKSDIKYVYVCSNIIFLDKSKEIYHLYLLVISVLAF